MARPARLLTLMRRCRTAAHSWAATRETSGSVDGRCSCQSPVRCERARTRRPAAMGWDHRLNPRTQRGSLAVRGSLGRAEGPCCDSSRARRELHDELPGALQKALAREGDVFRPPHEPAGRRLLGSAGPCSRSDHPRDLHVTIVWNVCCGRRAAAFGRDPPCVVTPFQERRFSCAADAKRPAVLRFHPRPYEPCSAPFSSPRCSWRPPRLKVLAPCSR
jgi:hypothetical protein